MACPAARSLCASPPWLLGAHPASGQSLHLRASVSLSVAGDGDAEGDDKNTKGVKNAWTRKEPAEEGDCFGVHWPSLAS